MIQPVRVVFSMTPIWYLQMTLQQFHHLLTNTIILDLIGDIRLTFHIYYQTLLYLLFYFFVINRIKTQIMNTRE